MDLFCIYRPPNSQNLIHFFNELPDSLSKANESYENFIVMGNFNTDIGISNSDHVKLEQFCSLFNLQSLIKKETYIATFVKSLLTKLNPKTVYYKNFKKFDENSFLNDVKETNFELSTNDPNVNYRFITDDTLIKIVERQAPLKKRFVRGNQAPFMNKELRKAVYIRSRLRNNFCKNPTKEKENKYKVQRNKYISLRKKSIKKFFKNISIDGVVSIKRSWSMRKPFLTNKGHINVEEILLKCDNETIAESSVLAEMFNSHYINIVEKTSGKKPSHFTRDNNVSDTRQAIDLIVQSVFRSL